MTIGSTKLNRRQASELACDYARAAADAGPAPLWNETFVKALAEVNHSLVPIPSWFVPISVEDTPIGGPFPKPDCGKPFPYPALVAPKGWSLKKPAALSQRRTLKR